MSSTRFCASSASCVRYRLRVSICDPRRTIFGWRTRKAGERVTPDAPNLRFLTSETEGWQDVHGDGEAAFSSFLTQVLTSRQLAVLCGLGTSRCVVDRGGEPLAPNMNDLWRAVKEADEDQFQRVLEIVSS